MSDYERWKNFHCIGIICWECEHLNNCKEYVAKAEKELMHKKTKKEGPEYD